MIAGSDATYLRGLSALSRPSRAHRAGRRPRPDRAALLCERRRRADPVRRGELYGRVRQQSRIRARRLSPVVQLDGQPGDGLRLSPRRGPARGAQGPGNPLGLRRLAICDRAADAPRARRQEIPVSVVYKKGFKKDGKGPAVPLRLWRLRLCHPAGLLDRAAEPGRPRLCLCHRPYPRRRRPRLSMVHGWQARQAHQHLQRLRRRGERADRRGLHRARADRDPGRLGRRRADGRGRQLRPRAVGRGRRRRAVRRRARHDARRHAAADPGRMARMGQPDQRQGRVRADPELFALTTRSGRRPIRRC